MASWRARDPVVRFRNWLVSEGWWDEAQEKEARRTYRQQVRLHGRRGVLCYNWSHLRSMGCLS